MLASDLTVKTEGTSSLTLIPNGLGLTTHNLTKEGPGTCVLGSGLFLLGNVNVNGGTLQLAKDLLTFEGGDVQITAGATLKTSGTVNRRVLGGPGGTLEVLGTTDIGLSSQTDGYAFGGNLMVGPHGVGLMDLDLAELRGASLAGGSLASLRGIHLLPVVAGDEGSYIKGYGKISGNVVAGTNMPDPTPDKPARIWAVGGTIEFTGILSGAWTPIGSLKISGLARPGFSAYLGKAGAPSTIGQMEFEIYGNVGQQDKLPPGIVNELNLPMADPAHGYDQVIAYGDLPPGDPFFGSGRVDIEVLGPFTLQFPDPDGTGPLTPYQPKAGDDFRLLFAHEFDPLNGEFDADFGPGASVVPGAKFQYLPKFMTDLTALVNSLPALGAGLSYQPYLHEDAFGITVVPEPGTLALLITGAFGLLLVWRRQRS